MPETFAVICSLMKPRISGMVIFATTAGYLLASRGAFDFVPYVVLIGGTLATCAGATVLNQYLERDTDRLMERTRNRPLVTGSISAANALGLGLLLVTVGVSSLGLFLNTLTAFLALLTAFIYVLIYTPLKRVTWLNTLIGAIPGALPPVGGWVAVTGQIDMGAVILFALLFVWQLPHFYSIAWMYREDYGRAGLRMLAVVDSPDGKRTFRHILGLTVVLIPVSLAPYFAHLAGPFYAVIASVSGVLLLYTAWRLSQLRTVEAARGMMKATVLYLPLLLTVAVLNVVV